MTTTPGRKYAPCSGSSYRERKSRVDRVSVNARSQLAEANYARKMAGLPLLEVKVRTCLACKQEFESIEHRTCGCLGESVIQEVYYE